MAFIIVCDAAEMPEGASRRIDAEPEPIAVFNVDGNFYAIGDTCTHGDWSLAEGYLEGSEVECTLHAGKFCVKTGAACALPAVESVKVYPVRVLDGVVQIDPAGGFFAIP